MRAAATAAASATVALVVFGLLVPHGFLNGDAPVYAERIATRSLGNGSVHLGYYLAGLFFTRLLPIDPPLALNMMSAIAAALCVGLVVTISYTTTGRVSAGIAAAATLVALPVFAENAVFAGALIAVAIVSTGLFYGLFAGKLRDAAAGPRGATSTISTA